MILTIWLALVAQSIALPPVIKIGAIFTDDQKESRSVLAFRYAIHKINKDKTLLPNTTLVYDIQYVPKADSFRTTKKTCEQVSSGVQAVFGPADPVLGGHVHSICDALDLPHIETRLELDPSARRELSINLHPAQSLLNTAYMDLMQYLNWTRIAILYEEDYGLMKLRELVRAENMHVEVHLLQAEPANYRNILKEIRIKEITTLVIDINPENISPFLKSILHLQMNDYKYHYLFTTFDLETYDLEELRYNFLNLTAFRMIDVDDMSVREVLKGMQRFQPHMVHNKSKTIQAQPALMYDSVLVFAVGLQTLEQSHPLALANVSCSRDKAWDGGLSLINYINSVELKGLSGPIEFKEGRRVQFKLDVVKLKRESLVKVGEWSPQSGVNITDSQAFFDSTPLNVTLLVITILETPYVMIREGPNATGNARYVGFCIDLLRMVAEIAGFQYTIQLVPDGKYGVYDPETGEWNGIVRQLMDKKADLAVGSMTINYARESVIDFTKPFMNLGISILFKVPKAEESRMFSFMNPLAVEIWLYVLAAYILVSVTMFIVARFSPYEWENPHPCDIENDVVENQFSLANSFWFTIGTLMQQGSDLNPKATSTRIVGGIWWFFTLIIISSYTANLAAFLTVERMITPIENSDDLASQTDISYGTLDSGSTMTFFRDSMIETYKKMWRFMENKKVFVGTYEEGIKRVLEGNYAFLMESTMLDYIVQRDCNLTQIGSLLDTKGYGIATPMGSPWRDKISLAILDLQEKGEIQMLYDKWWKNPGDTCIRNEKNKESKANSLGVDSIGGVFVVLLCGLAIAMIIAIVEFCYHSKRNGHVERRVGQSLFAEMTDELCFAMKCRNSSRQHPALKRQCSKCMDGPTYVSAAPPPIPPPPPPRPCPPYDTAQFNGPLFPVEIQPGSSRRCKLEVACQTYPPAN